MTYRITRSVESMNVNMYGSAITPFVLSHWMDSVHARPIPPPINLCSLDSFRSSSSSRNRSVSFVSGPRNGYLPVVMEASNGFKRKAVTGSAGYVLEDVPHLSDYIPDLPVRCRFLEYIIHHSIKLLSLLLNLLTNLPFGG